MAAEWLGLDNLHTVADITIIVLIVRFIFLRQFNRLFVERVLFDSIDSDDNRFVHFVAGHDPYEEFALISHLPILFSVEADDPIGCTGCASATTFWLLLVQVNQCGSNRGGFGRKLDLKPRTLIHITR